MSSKPVAVDLYCGLGGWSQGLIDEGYEVTGFDIERHEYGDMKYPGTLVLADVCSLHGADFKDAALIVASPPCQEYSYMAMPWSLAKRKAAAIRADTTGEALAKLNRLFNECFRIQREASFAAGRHIPLVVENVRGAQPWVGRARWNFGSFYLWGDVPALMPATIKAQKFNPDGTAHPSGSWFAIADSKNRGARSEGQKVPGFRFDGSGRSFQTASVDASGINGRKGFVPEGTKALGKHGHPRILPQIVNKTGSGSVARKMASAMIAMIPLTLSRHIGASYKPQTGDDTRGQNGDD